MQHKVVFFLYQVRDNHHQFPTSSCIVAHFPQSELSSKNILSMFRTSVQTPAFSPQGYIVIQTYYLKEG